MVIVYHKRGAKKRQKQWNFRLFYDIFTIEMYIKTLVRTVCLILCVSLFGACGDLETVIPTYNTYQISALLNNHIELEEYSLVQENDSLQPYCDRSIANDPDIRGLQVLIQNSRKETLNGRVRYVLNIPEPGEPGETDETGETQEPNSPDTNSPDTNFPDAYFPDAFFPLAEFRSSDMPDNGYEGDEGQAKEPGQETEPPDELSGVIPNETSDRPPEEINQTETDQEELLKIGNDEIVFNVDRLDTLPAFTLPDDLRIGAYTMIIKVLGEYNILGEVELNFYYMGNAKLALKDIAMYLPGSASESLLIPPGTTVLLEAKVEADTRLNPYIVWYNGKNVIKEGNLSEGAGFMLWKAPEQNGFRSLRAEVFPFRSRERLKGIHRDIVLPVSAKALKADFFASQTLIDFSELIPDPKHDHNTNNTDGTNKTNKTNKTNNTDETDEDEAEDEAPLRARLSDMMHWYQFAATLEDSLQSEKALQAKNEKEPRWAPLTYSYGLATGPNDIYELPPLTFVKKSEKQGGGLFLFRIKPAADGTVLHATLASSEAPEQLTMELRAAGGFLSLLLSTAESKADVVSVPIGNESDHPVVTAALVLYIFPEHIEARLITENIHNGAAASTLRVSGLMNGQCRVSLGKADAPNKADAPKTDDSETDSEPKTENRENTERNRRQNRTEKTPVSAVWDQLAILYIAPPPEPVKDTESPDLEKTETAPATAPTAGNAAAGANTDNSGQTAAATDTRNNPELAEPQEKPEHAETTHDETDEINETDQINQADAVEPPMIINIMLPEDLLTDAPDTL